MKNFWIFFLSYIHKNQQKIPDFEGVVRFLLRQKIKKIFEKNMTFSSILPIGVNIAQPIKSIMERFLMSLTIFYHTSVCQTLILSQKTISFMENK